MTSPALAAPSFAIREMQPSDIPAVSELAGRIWRTHYPAIISHQQIEYMLPRACSPESIKKYIAEKKQRFWLGYCNDILSGYIAVEPREKNGWFIDKLYVDTETHGKGLGGALLKHVTRELKPQKFTLRVNRKNVKAVNFYFKHGFVIEGLDVLDLGASYVMDDFLMKKIL